MKHVKILFDAGPIIDDRKSGVGYFVTALISNLESDYSDRFSLYGYFFSFLNRTNSRVPSIGSVHFKPIILVPGKLIALCRRLKFQPFIELLVVGNYDIIFSTNYVALPSARNTKKILAVYDLCFLDMPEYVQERNLKYLSDFCPNSIKNADIIVTISNETKERIKYHFPSLKAAVVVTPIPPVETTPVRAKLPKRLQALGIRRKSYILYIGTIEPRKNLANLVQAYSQLSHKSLSSYSLVLAGGKGWKDQDILEKIDHFKNLGLDIIQTGYVSDLEKKALYNNAHCFIMPSHYEGFGMPILEAMNYDVPVAMSDIPVFHEVAGRGGLFFDQNNPDDITKKLEDIIADDELRTKLIIEARRLLSKYSWKDSAHTLYKAIDGLINEAS